jgi:hypothetical protein
MDRRRMMVGLLGILLLAGFLGGCGGTASEADLSTPILMPDPENLPYNGPNGYGYEIGLVPLWYCTPEVVDIESCDRLGLVEFLRHPGLSDLGKRDLLARVCVVTRAGTTADSTYLIEEHEWQALSNLAADPNFDPATADPALAGDIPVFRADAHESGYDGYCAPPPSLIHE